MDDRRIFLRSNVPLTGQMIDRIQKLGFQGVYISDDLSKDLVVANLISDKLKYKAKKEVKTLFIQVENQKKTMITNQMDVIGSVIGDIVDEILYNRNIMVNVVDLRTFDDYTFSHSLNVAVLSVIMGAVLDLNRSILKELAMGALIHDIGKVFVDKTIINKPDKLTPEELAEVRKHSQYGFDYLSAHCKIPDNAMKAVLSHHEQLNGKGYPNGLKGEDIHLFGRIICVADVYDALSSDRPYRRAMLPSDAVEYIMGGYNTMFDPRVVAAFVRKVAPYPVGTCVRLSTGQTGIVVQNFESSCLRPMVRLIEEGKPVNEFIDLANDHSKLNVTIQEVIVIN